MLRLTQRYTEDDAVDAEYQEVPEQEVPDGEAVYQAEGLDEDAPEQRVITG